MTLEQLPLIMLRALVLTIIIECGAAWLLGVRTRRDQAAVILANLLTNPLVVSAGAAVQFFIGHKALLPATLVMEILIVAVEGLVYKRELRDIMDPYMLSLICNLVSFAIGEILNRSVF